MKDIGFIYVLANSSMPNAIKVGKTKRSTAERSQELSGATGLPTPFIVVYEQLFEDCTAAETFIHALLGQKGYRISANREFFNAPVNEVVKAITLAPGAIQGSEALPLANTEEEDELFGEHGQDELDDMTLEIESAVLPASYPWYSLFDEAESQYYGWGDIFQDYAEALRLYSQAAKLGCLAAYQRIGGMHEEGRGTSQNKEKALNFYKEGVRRGNVYCYWRMASLFIDEENFANADKAFSLFLKNQRNELPDEQHRFIFDDSQIALDCGLFLHHHLHYEMELSESLKQVIVERRDAVIYEVLSAVNTLRETNVSDLAEKYQAVVSHLHSI
ncbi:Sel1 repeat-containing protein [Collimonas sp. PA-H2]|uniref:GIY-YIG nuclease family protein n=1 Tax=Collimonas sp. PA-H2 TaxID=1881062 RepID=UPI000C00D2DA|nr:GIY-YIG nuclease family protein [Collimonas sp. PA-H2]PFH08809.1 Sel1 repeat-containing protein [Collimonas sp. PA-H2]